MRVSHLGYFRGRMEEFSMWEKVNKRKGYPSQMTNHIFLKLHTWRHPGREKIALHAVKNYTHVNYYNITLQYNIATATYCPAFSEDQNDLFFLILNTEVDKVLPKDFCLTSFLASTEPPFSSGKAFNESWFLAFSSEPFTWKMGWGSQLLVFFSFDN